MAGAVPSLLDSNSTCLTYALLKVLRNHGTKALTLAIDLAAFFYGEFLHERDAGDVKEKAQHRHGRDDGGPSPGGG